MKTLMLGFAILTLTAASAFACPNLNGSYSRKTGENSRSSISFKTEVLGDSYKYGFGGSEMWEATGVPKRIVSPEGSGSITVSCAPGLLTFMVAVDGEPRQTLRILEGSPTQIEIHGTGFYSGINGIYTKE